MHTRLLFCLAVIWGVSPTFSVCLAQDTVYRHPVFGFTLRVPDGWVEKTVEETDVFIFSKADGCGFIVASSEADVVVDPKLLLQSWEKAKLGVNRLIMRRVDVGTHPVAAVTAAFATYDGAETRTRIFMLQADRYYILTFTCPARVFDLRKDVMDRLVDGFRTGTSASTAQTPAPRESGWFGLFFTPGEKGLRITAVRPASSAALAGIRADDLLTAVAGDPIRAIADLPAMAKLGSEVDVDLRRAGRPLGVTLKQNQAPAASDGWRRVTHPSIGYSLEIPPNAVFVAGESEIYEITQFTTSKNETASILPFRESVGEPLSGVVAWIENPRIGDGKTWGTRTNGSYGTTMGFEGYDATYDDGHTRRRMIVLRLKEMDVIIVFHSRSSRYGELAPVFDRILASFKPPKADAR